jgi:hypothetical protein
MEKSGLPDESVFHRKHARLPRAVWVKEIKAFRDSGLSREEYAAKRGIHIVTLKRWIRRVGGDGAASKGSELPAFLPVRVVGSMANQRRNTAFQVEVDLANGRHVRVCVQSNADMQRLADLLAALDGGERC